MDQSYNEFCFVAHLRGEADHTIIEFLYMLMFANKTIFYILITRTYIFYIFILQIHITHSE